MFRRPFRLPNANTRPKARWAAYDRLIDAFLASPEGTRNPALQEAGCSEQEIGTSTGTLIQFAENYLHAYPATYDAAQMENLLLDICPRVLLLPHANTPRKFLLILEQFWRFLDRVYKQPHAAMVLERLSKIGDTFEQRMALPRSSAGLGPRPDTVSPFRDLTEAFDLHALDDDDEEDEIDEESWQDYLLGLIHHFRASPEGQSLLDSSPDHEDWLYYYLDYGRIYYAPPAELNRDDTESLLMGDLPRKVMPSADSRPEDAIPGLIAFWRYLQRAHRHPQAKKVLDYLHSRGLAEKFREAIFDRGMGGPAKRFLMAGQRGGHDMSDEREMDEFQMLFNEESNAGRSLPEGQPRLVLGGPFDDPLPGGGPVEPEKKRKRKTARAARKANKQKKKKK